MRKLIATAKQNVKLTISIQSLKIRRRNIRTYELIRMGGLVVKSKLSKLYEEDKETFLGALKYIDMLLNSTKQDEYLDLFKDIGAKEMKNKNIDKN